VLLLLERKTTATSAIYLHLLVHSPLLLAWLENFTEGDDAYLLYNRDGTIRQLILLAQHPEAFFRNNGLYVDEHQDDIQNVAAALTGLQTKVKKQYFALKKKGNLQVRHPRLYLRACHSRISRTWTFQLLGRSLSSKDAWTSLCTRD
jgi:hypothetical protein